jgi:hypothetical protein
MTTKTGVDYAWSENDFPDIAEAYCFTLVRGLTPTARRRPPAGATGGGSGGWSGGGAGRWTATGRTAPGGGPILRYATCCGVARGGKADAGAAPAARGLGGAGGGTGARPAPRDHSDSTATRRGAAARAHHRPAAAPRQRPPPHADDAPDPRLRVPHPARPAVSAGLARAAPEPAGASS